MPRLPKPAILVLFAILAIGCASSRNPSPPTELSVFHRLFITMPSHAAGFEIDADRSGSGHHEPNHISSQDAVRRAYNALRFELIDAGFDVVTRDGDADAVLELTMGGIGDYGDAERAFVVIRDGESGRVLLIFRARARAEARSVEEIMGRIVGAIEEKVAASPPGS